MGTTKNWLCVPLETHSQRIKCIFKKGIQVFLPAPFRGRDVCLSFTARHIPLLLAHIVWAGSGRPLSLGTVSTAGHLSGAILLRHTVSHTHAALLTGHLSESARHWAAITHRIVAAAKSTFSHRLKMSAAWPCHWATLIPAALHRTAAISTGALHCPTAVPSRAGHLLTLPPAGTHLPHHSAMCPPVPPVELYEFPYFFPAFLHFVDDFAHFFPVVGLICLD